jgi:hypothetical protein
MRKALMFTALLLLAVCGLMFKGDPHARHQKR